MQSTENILGHDVQVGGSAALVESIAQHLTSGSARWLACINPHSYVEALKFPEFNQALHESDWLVPDGIGFVIASCVLGGAIRERVTGSDVFKGVMEHANQCGNLRIFFLGSTNEGLQSIKQKVAVDYPNVTVAGIHSPPFKAEFAKEDISEMLRAINHAKPDILWVGMTAPKQEIWISANLQSLQTVRFAAAIGAVFDFYTGRVKRSHPVFQRIGMEWLPRLLQQPRRLWKRMFISAPVFMLHVVRARFRRQPLRVQKGTGCD